MWPKVVRKQRNKNTNYESYTEDLTQRSVTVSMVRGAHPSYGYKIGGLN
jgi:hypothetical protein